MADNGNHRLVDDEISVHNVHDLLHGNDGPFTAIGVRGADCVLEHVGNSTFIPLKELQNQRERLPAEKDAMIGVCCASIILSPAAARALIINPEIVVITYEERLTARTIFDVIKDYDVVDATDNIKTKLLLNDACYFAGKPYVFGGAVGFVGQASVLYPAGEGPCVRCLLPNHPEEGTTWSCSEAGVMGVVPDLSVWFKQQKY